VMIESSKDIRQDLDFLGTLKFKNNVANEAAHIDFEYAISGEDMKSGEATLKFILSDSDMNEITQDYVIKVLNDN